MRSNLDSPILLCSANDVALDNRDDKYTEELETSHLVLCAFISLLDNPSSPNGDTDRFLVLESA